MSAKTRFEVLGKARRRVDGRAKVTGLTRFADDIVDESPGDDVRARIDRWERELDRCYAGSPSHPITIALAHVAGRYPIPKSAFAGLIEGCRMDLVKSRYADFGELMVYSDLVATTISTSVKPARCASCPPSASGSASGARWWSPIPASSPRSS